MVGLSENVFLAVATFMVVTRATVTTNVDRSMKICQKCFGAVHDKHLFHVSFNEARLIGRRTALLLKTIRKLLAASKNV